MSPRPPRPLARLALPAIVIAAIALLPATGRAAPGDSNWSGFGTRLQGTVVNALAPYGSYLYAGGNFSSADGIPVANIARYDGSAWDSVGAGISGYVRCMCVYDNQLYVAGTLSSAGGVPVHDIAMWDGSSWHDVGGGLWFDTYPPNDGAVWGMTVWNGNLYVMGQFTRYGGTTLVHGGVVAWNGSSWFEPGCAFGNPPGTACPYGTGLYFGGYIISNVNGFHWVEAWNGTSLATLAGDPDNTPYCMTDFQGSLVVGGLFANVNGSPARFIASWNGSTWSALGSGMGPGTAATSQSVNALLVQDNVLVAGGYFGTAGGQPASFIASWDGSTWRPLGSGTDYTVGCLASWNGDLYVGGGFTHAGGVSSNLVARWSGSPLAAVPGTPTRDVLALAPARPTPFRGVATLDYSLPRAGRAEIAVFDLAGRRIATLVEGPQAAGAARTVWDGRDASGRPQAAGVYLARLVTDQGTATRRLVLTR